MLCRSKERGTAALNSIKDDKRVDDSSKIHLHVVDLSEPEQIKAFAADFKRRHQKVDILVNNAAVMPNELRTNSRGTEVALATNLVGFYGLTTQLSPLLKQSQDPRIVNVVSAGMFTAKLDIPTIEKGLDVQKDKVKGESNTEDEDYSGITLYAQHHRARVDLTDYFADIYKDDGIKVNCVHRKSKRAACSIERKKEKKSLPFFCLSEPSQKSPRSFFITDLPSLFVLTLISWLGGHSWLGKCKGTFFLKKQTGSSSGQRPP